MVPTLLSLLVAAAVGVVNATPVPRADTQPCWAMYTSLPGDTCVTIAVAFHITTTDVYDANTFLNCNDIWPNTPICVYGKSQVTVTGIPPAAPTTLPGSGTTCWNNYRSQLGETCNSIGARFGITPEAVYNANPFLNCDNIWDGTPISICVGDDTRTRTTVVNTPTQIGPYPTASPATVCFSTESIQGDTCDTIATRYNVTAAEVHDRNGFLNCNDIWTNTPILICILLPNPNTPVQPPITSVATTTRSNPEFCWTTYSQQGDTCDIIAARLGISSADVWDKNRFVNCNDIWTNTPLVICQAPPSPTTTASQACWTVRSQPGDTCDTIGTRFGRIASEIYNANTFLNCNDIWTNTPIALCYQPLGPPPPTITGSSIIFLPPATSTPIFASSHSSTMFVEYGAAPTETSTSSSSSEAEYIIPTPSSSSEAEYVVPTTSSSEVSSSSSAEEYIVPTPSSSSSPAEYIVPTPTSSPPEVEYVVPTVSTSTSSSSAVEYIVPVFR